MESKFDVKEVSWPHPASDPLWKMFNGYRSTLAIIPACELKLFDKVAAHPEGVSAARLAEENSWSTVYTTRLLDAQASFGLLKKKLGPDNIGVYHITDSGKYMVSDFKGSFDGIYTLFSKMYLKSMANVAELVKSGDEGDKAHWVLPQLQVDGSAGKQGQSSDAEQKKPDQPKCAEQCGEGKCKGVNELRMYQIMEALMYPYTDELVQAFDLSAFKTVVDIGGGTGMLSYALSRTYPDMKVTLMELPEVIRVAKQHFQPPDFDKLKVTYLEGDCIKDPVPEASLYIFCKVVHHFPEEKIEYVMNKLYKQLPAGGAVLLLEDVLKPMRDGPAPAHCFDLMTMSRKVGKNRTLQEYASILERCRFTKIKCLRTNDECVYDLIMAFKE